MSEIGEEEIARALCRRQIIANLRYDPPRDDEEQFIQRCEDASWSDDAWLGPARDLMALLRPAIERAREGERERCAKVADAMAEDMTISIGKIGSQMLIDRYQVGANDMWAVAAAIRKG